MNHVDLEQLWHQANRLREDPIPESLKAFSNAFFAGRTLPARIHFMMLTAPIGAIVWNEEKQEPAYRTDEDERMPQALEAQHLFIRGTPTPDEAWLKFVAMAELMLKSIPDDQHLVFCWYWPWVPTDDQLKYRARVGCRTMPTGQQQELTGLY